MMQAPLHPSPAGQDVTAAPHAGSRVLIVEDDATAARALSEILRHLGCSVTIAGSVAAALRLLRSQPFDHALLDLMLPDGIGTEVLEVVRSIGLRTRVTIISASADEEMLRRARSQRPDAFLAKPLDVRRLITSMGLQ